MLKTGIHRRGQLSPAALSTFFGRRRFIAVTLYPEVAAEQAPDTAELLASILRRFPGPGGTYKRTQRGRFDAFDAALRSAVAERLPPDGRLAVHDLAVSDGGTALDLYRALAGIPGIRLAFTASDMAPDVLALSTRGSPLVAVIDPTSGRALQVIRPPFVFNVEKRESALLYPVNRLLLAILLRTEVARLLRRFRASDPEVLTSPIRLLAPEAITLLDRDDGFRFVRHDIRDPLPARYDLIRAMNILNPDYFDEATLASIVDRIAAVLPVGGILATGSNQDAGSVVDGAIYQREADGFRLLMASGAGSPVDRLVRSGSRSR